MRLRLLLSIFFVVWAILVARVYMISIEGFDRYSRLAERNTIKQEPLIPVRGTIFDRNGEALAVNKLGFKISLKPHLSYKSRLPILREHLHTLSVVLPDLNATMLEKAYRKNDSPYQHDDVEVVQFVPYKDMLPHFTYLSQFETIRIKPTTLRFYPYGKHASHILGYVSRSNAKSGPEKIIGVEGKAGIEKQYNERLQGTLGERVFQVSATNEEIAELERIEPSTNQDMTLHLDIKLQEHLSYLFEGKAGAAIVMDLETGGVLAAGSFPGYDTNAFVTGISSEMWKSLNEDPKHPFLNKLVNSMYPPGSTIKMSVGLAFMENPQLEPYNSFYCSGTYVFGNRKFRCWKNTGHGQIALREAIQRSCDIYFYKGSYRVGINAISTKLRDFGFGQKTGIDLPNEFMGVVPSREWKLQRYNKPWYIGETFITSIGQGSFLATPIQLAYNTGLLATGSLIRPTIAKQIGDEVIEPQMKHDIFTPSDERYIEEIRKGMSDVVNAPFGTANMYVHSDIPIAGKTGTAQVVGISQETKTRMKESEMEYYKRSHAYLTTYAPAGDPRYSVTVMVEHGGHGGHAAGPIVSGLYDLMQRLGYF